MFSGRVPPDLAPNPLARLLARQRASGVPLLDLTETNPTRVGLAYPPELLQPLGQPASLVYEPQPFGLAGARQAVATELARRGITVPPSRIVLTASTSEAYSILFKLLCDPGDEVLVPEPSYPLFDHLTRLDAVTARPYRLEFAGRWAVDLDSVDAVLSPRTRAILAVNPNNPTGSFLSAGEIAALSDRCARRGLVLIGDEVFADYPLEETAAQKPSVLDQPVALTFSLGGLSKAVGLPQLKLAWIAAAGPDRYVADALGRLEVICDAYLSVATPVQHAAGELLRQGAALRAAIAARVRRNWHALGARMVAHPSCTRLPCEGGWSAIIQVPATVPEEARVLMLVERDHVLVHPGYFFDFPREAFLVVSLLPRPDVFDEGVARLLAAVA